jgi:ankyrin repeat protein
VVQFSHFSVKEFLTSSRIADSSADVSRFHILLEPAHTILAEACLCILLRLGGLVDEDNVKVKFPLTRYAAEHWVDHVRYENVSSHIRERMEDLFDPDKPHFAAWLQVRDIDTLPLYRSLLYYFAYTSHDGSKKATPLYYAALCGFHGLTKQLVIKHRPHVNTVGGYFMSPLGAALRGEHFKVAQVLYDHGADVNVRGSNDRTALYGASCSGHFEIVQWLLSHGANPNFRGKGTGSWTPLHGAAFFGHVGASQLLLQYKADINNRDASSRTPLHVAAQYQRVDVVRLLLEHGADVNARDISQRTPLFGLVDDDVDYRDLEVARLLVEHGANIDVEDSSGRTAFQVASEIGYHDFAKFLSDRSSK